MATNNINSNYFSVAAYTNKGLSGMVSGMDTENMVRQMMSGTQKKIDRQMALKQQTLWRQAIYRDIINSINLVRNKYFNPAFDASPLNNLASGKFFNAKTSTVTPSISGSAAIKVLSTSANAMVGDMSIEVLRLASAATLSSQYSVGAGDSVAGKDIASSVHASFNKNLNLMINNENVFVDLNGIDDPDAMVAKINEALSAFVSSSLETTDATASIVNGQLKIFSESGDYIRVGNATTPLASRMTGLSFGQTSNVAGTGQILNAGSMINPGAGVTITVNLDGVDKLITLNPASNSSGQVTVETVKDSLQETLDRAFGNYINVNTGNDDPITLTLKPGFGGLEGHTLSIYGTEAGKLGIVPGASTRLNTSSKIGDIDGLMGERFAFSVNGVNFSFTKDDTIGAMINKVNSSNAGVTMTYSSISGQFKLTANVTGSQGKIDVVQKEGDLLGAIFKDEFDSPMFNPSNTAVSTLLTANAINGNAIDDTYTFTNGAKFTINVDGADYTFTLSTGATGVNGSTMLDGLNDWLKDKFGTDDGTSAGTPNIEFVGGQLIVRDGSLVKFAQTEVNTGNAAAYQAGLKTDIALALGLNNIAKNNLVTADSAVDDIYQLNGLITALQDNFPFITIPATVGELGTLKDSYPLLFAGIMDHAEIGFSDGRLTLTATTGTALNLADPNSDPAAQIRNAFGVLLGGLDSLVYHADGGSLSNEALFNAGMDAELKVNGMTTTRSGNTFEIDGITMQLVAVSEPGDPTVIRTERDTESIVSSFKSFVDDYNDMISKLYGYVREETLFRDYAPLTDEQKKEMSDRDIELWEQNAKTGLIRNDMEVMNLLNNLYSTLYTKPLSSNYALYDIGIEATDYKKPGILFLDEDKLRAALLNDPASVENLFMDPINGLAKQMGNLMDNAARVSLANPGSLVALAGVENSVTDKSNELNTRIDEINDKLKDLWERYEKERARYWQRFNTMERILAQYQAQSEWIYQNMVMGMDY